MSDFVKAMLFTAVPICVTGLLAIFTARANFSFSLVTVSLIAGAVCFLAAFIAAIVFAATRRMKIAAGIFTGMAIGAVALGASCFASIFTSNL
jgi:hypothetical protein